ncbi:MAG: leucine-rich repeat protein [Bacteroidales bacterium]|jgi:hypothetical protein|nr:leucine-rich repeat protein [Bacteroidales bacterium]
MNHIKKKLTALIAVSVLVLLFVSCDVLKPEPEPEPEIILSQSEFVLSSDSTIIEVEVKANVEFGVMIQGGWITRNLTKVSTSTKLFFNIAKNESYNKREDFIVIKQKNGPLEKSIRVFQSQNDAIIISSNNVEISWESQVLEVELNTNVEIEVIIPAVAKDWVSYTGTKALRTWTLLFSIAENETYEARSTELYVKNTATKLQDTLTVYQQSNLGLLVTPSEFDLSYEATTIEVEIQANVEYDVIISDDWITEITTKGLSTATLSFGVGKNETYDNREGTITIKQKNGTLSSTIKIYQSQEDVIILSHKSFELSSESHTLEVEMKTNVDFEVIIPEAANNWVSYTGTKALRTETLLLNITANDSDTPRSTELYVKNKANDLQDTLIVKQDGNEPGVYRVTKMGTLGTILNQTQKDTITTMIIKGEINWVDFEVMKLHMPKLLYLDLKDVICEDDKIPNIAFGSTFTGAVPFYPINKTIRNIILPLSIKTIGKGAFGYCTGLTGTLHLPEGLTSIEHSAFFECTGFTGVNFPDGLTTIGAYAFWGCKGFTGSLILPEGLTTIGREAFGYCTGLNGELNLPTGLTMINEGTFNECTGLTGSLTIPEGVLTIAFAAFLNCRGFNGSLILPDGLTMIGESAFCQCGFTGELSLPGSLTMIGESAFSGCRGFTGSLYIPDGVTKIEQYAFCECGFTGELRLPAGLTMIGACAFFNCRGFTGSLNLPDGLTVISQHTFYDCNGFTGSLNLPDGLKKIESWAFTRCGFTGLVIGNNLESIEELAFHGCSNISGNVIFPISLNYIGKKGFDSCSKVDAFRFPHTTPLSYSEKMLTAGATVEVPTSAVDTYKATDGWKDYNIVGY